MQDGLIELVKAIILNVNPFIILQIVRLHTHKLNFQSKEFAIQADLT